LFGKAEWFNPTGSVKDRAALSIVTTAERSGALRPGKTILDATSGNAGIAYAMIAAARGYRVRLAVPKNANIERKRILRAYGVDLVYTNPLEGSDGASRKARELFADNPDAYFYADQYSNEANWRSHYDGTGVEIWNQTGGSVSHFVAGVGSGGTIMGVGKKLREHNPRVEVTAVQPDSPFHGLEGLKHIPTSVVPKIYDPAFPDRIVEVSTEDAQQMVKQLARTEGIMVGPSSGAALVASVKIAWEIERGTLVAILADSGERYLSERFWEEA
jgi:cysteine synthase B